MKKLFSTIALTLATAGMLLAGVDGKYSYETKMPEGKGKRAGSVITTVIDLKAAGDKLSGTVTLAAGKRDRTAEIKEGKVEGNTVSFTTVMTSRKGESSTINWKGTVEGDELKGTRAVAGRKRSQEFVAKRK